MNRLLLLRHAKSSWDDPSLADHERPLAPRGHRAAESMAEHLRSSVPHPDLVLCSSALRTRETLDRMSKAFGDAEVVVDDGLYGRPTTCSSNGCAGLPTGSRRSR
jgi:phosphohistidine phosphatase